MNLSGFDVRFSYDSTKLQPSCLETNEVTDNAKMYFQFEEEFKQALEFFTIPYDKEGEGIRGTVSFNPPITESEHIIDKEGVGKVVNTDGGVLLGKMSFQMTADVFDSRWLQLVENTTYPVTGIKINIDGIKNFQAQSTFRFTDETASKDADLKNLIVSTGQVNETQPEDSTYQEYSFTPNFDKDIINYELNLLEYVDCMNIKAIQNDAKANMKIKLPKRDESDNLVYEADGSTILYEEKTIQNEIPLQFVLNKLGEPDTVITIEVTAENKTTTKKYTLVIKRPYGTITGKLTTYNSKEIHVGAIKIYRAGEINWEDYYVPYNNLQTREDLPQPLSTIHSEEDGTFSINVIPGKYDIMVDKACYFDYITQDNEITENETKNIGTIELIPGDINKDGIIDAKDFNNIKLYFGQNYVTADIDESGTIDAPDFNAVKFRFGQFMEI